MTIQKTDSELMARLLELIAEASALGADALVDAAAPGTVTITRWLTDAATGFTLAAGSRAVMDGVQLSPVWRSRVEAFLAGYSFWQDDDE